MAGDCVLLNASVLVGGAFTEKDLLIRNGRIERIGNGILPVADSGAFPVIDAAGKKVLPGFIDIHTHGAIGVDFNRARADDIRKVCSFFAAQGVTSFLPCVMTDSTETMERQLTLLSSDGIVSDCPQILGIHLEGPFLSVRYKGAMPERLLRPCDEAFFDKLQQAARGMIRLVTLSPELEGAESLVRKLCGSGVRVSLGHSGASYEQATRAIEAGAVCATHIMNAMKMLHMHDPGILAAVLESGIHAEMICDGFHLHPPIVRLLLKIKGNDRMIAVTDSIMAAGFPDGKYRLGQDEILVEGGDAKLVSDGARAGSTLTMIKAVNNIRDFTGLPLELISPLVSENPARMLGIFAETGSIRKGKRADLVLLDGDGTSDLKVAMTIVRGTVAYDSAYAAAHATVHATAYDQGA